MAILNQNLSEDKKTLNSLIFLHIHLAQFINVQNIFQEVFPVEFRDAGCCKEIRGAKDNY